MPQNVQYIHNYVKNFIKYNILTINLFFVTNDNAYTIAYYL